MDEQASDVEALSINPIVCKVDRDLAMQIIKIQNETLAEACAKHPERFVAFATWPCSSPIWPRAAGRRREEVMGCAALLSAATSPARDQRTRSSTRSGPSRAARRARSSIRKATGPDPAQQRFKGTVI